METNTSTSTITDIDTIENAKKYKFILKVLALINKKNVLVNNFFCNEALHQLRFIFCDRSNRTPQQHTTIPIYNPLCDRHINIDTNIAPLIELLWLNGISTVMSCENNVPNGYVWISLATSFDLELFLEIVFKDTDRGNDFYDRGFPGFGKKNGWYYTVNTHRSKNKENMFPVTISVRFPQKDYATILKKIRDHHDNINNTKILHTSHDSLLGA